MKLLGTVIFSMLLANIESSRILVVCPTISKSHIIPLQLLSLDLADNGHNITFVSTYPLERKVNNYRDVRIPFDEADKDFMTEMASGGKSGSFFSSIRRVLALSSRIANETVQQREVRQLMNEETFDLVIVGQFLLTETMLGLADHFKCPSIVFSPAGVIVLLNQMTGNPLAVDGASHLMLNDKKMDFLERVKTFFATGLEIVMTEYLKYRARQIYKLEFHETFISFLRNYFNFSYNFPSDRYRSYDESLQNVSLVLINSHFTSGVVRPLVPNMIEIGGIQVKPKPSQLPEVKYFSHFRFSFQK